MIRNLDLPVGLDKMIHQTRLLKLAREGRQMIVHDLSKFEPNRRYATIIALMWETHAKVIDEIIELHDRIIGSLFTCLQRNRENYLRNICKVLGSIQNILNRARSVNSMAAIGWL